MAETTTNGERPREDPEKTLWMGDLAFEWDEAFIADLFEGFGAVTAYRPYDPRADRPTLYAFVTFERGRGDARLRGAQRRDDPDTWRRSWTWASSSAAVAPYAGRAALSGASLKALKAAHEPAADCHFAEVRLGEADRDVHGFPPPAAARPSWRLCDGSALRSSPALRDATRDACAARRSIDAADRASVGAARRRGAAPRASRRAPCPTRAARACGATSRTGSRRASAAARGATRAWLAACDGERASLVAAATASAPPERWTDATFDVARRTLAGGSVELRRPRGAAALTAGALANLEARYVERPSRFCSQCLVVARTYEATLADAGQHGQLPAAAFRRSRAWGCDFELFASPLNATLPRYCSLHASDVPFGSSGSFFDFDLAAGGNRGEPALLPARRRAAPASSAPSTRGDAVALSIALVVPDDRRQDRAAALRAGASSRPTSACPRATRTAAAPREAGPWTCPFGTYVTVLQTRAARLRWPAADLADRLYESFFADGRPRPSADRVFL
ncbi:hypothetical protein JL721_8324 [Aureococcus anophagefferens]|nr:hypothetical protein JL721_8324 [Aureococcus anophagefferens]